MFDSIPKHFFEVDAPQTKPFVGQNVLLIVGPDRKATHAQDVAEGLIQAGLKIEVCIEPGAELYVGRDAFTAVGCKNVFVEKDFVEFSSQISAPDFILGAGSSTAIFKQVCSRFSCPAFNTSDVTSLHLLDSSPATIGIVKSIIAKERGDLIGQKIVISAGGNRESIDSVRWLGNRSSGKQGHAIAEAARDRGANVVLITSAVASTPAGLDKVIGVETHAELKAAVDRECLDARVYIGTAAVADFSPFAPKVGKIERSAVSKLTLELLPTGDIIAGILPRPGLIKVAFSAETGSDEDNLERARRKLTEKTTDLVVLNDVLASGIGFGASHNRVAVISKNGGALYFPEDRTSSAHKYDVAMFVLERVKELYTIL